MDVFRLLKSRGQPDTGPGPACAALRQAGWLAQLTAHLPNRKEHMVRYCEYYSNKSRGQRKKAEQDNAVVNILDPVQSDKASRKSWARLIQKVGACPGPDPGKWTRYYAPNVRGR